MNLKDLLVSYKQVDLPQFNNNPVELPTSNNLPRLYEFKQNTSLQQQSTDKPKFDWNSGIKGSKQEIAQSPDTSENITSHNGYNMFKTLLAKYERETGDIMSEEKKLDLARLARLESSFNSNATNKASSAAGYFQLIRSNRKGMSDLLFLKDTNALFAAASRLYDSNYKALSKYSDNNQLTRFLKVYGFWFNPKATELYLLGLNVLFKDGLGTSLQEIFKRAKLVS